MGKGIRKKRATVLEKINERQAQPIEAYTVERAIKDALDYHESCTIRAGLEEASSVVSESALKAEKDAKIAQGDAANVIKALITNKPAIIRSTPIE